MRAIYKCPLCGYQVRTDPLTAIIEPPTCPRCGTLLRRIKRGGCELDEIRERAGKVPTEEIVRWIREDREKEVGVNE